MPEWPLVALLRALSCLHLPRTQLLLLLRRLGAPSWTQLSKLDETHPGLSPAGTASMPTSIGS